MDEILERGNRTEIRQIIRMAQRQKSARRNGKKDKKMDPDKLVQANWGGGGEQLAKQLIN